MDKIKLQCSRVLQFVNTEHSHEYDSVKKLSQQLAITVACNTYAAFVITISQSANQLCFRFWTTWLATSSTSIEYLIS